VPSTTGELQCFPEGIWDREMQIAGELHFAHIEWLVPAAGFRESPLLKIRDCRRIHELSTALDLRIAVICVDPLLAIPLWHADAEGLVEKVASAAVLIEAEGLVLPLMEASTPDDIELARCTLVRLARSIEPSGLRLYVEVTADADRAEHLVSDYNPHTLGLCLDTGNLTRAGIDPFDWFERLSQRVSHVHLKNVGTSGKNVVFSDGVVDIPTFARQLTLAGYRGRFTLETARGEDPVQTAREHRRLVLSAQTADYI